MKQPNSGEDFFFFKIFGGDKKKMDLINISISKLKSMDHIPIE